MLRGRKAEVVRHNWNELHCAARDGQVEVVKRILHDVLCGVDDRTPINETALHKAVRGNSVEICKLLLLQGSDPNLTNKGGRSPIYFVLDPAVAEVLLQAGAETDITDKWEGRTPLEFIKEQSKTNPKLEEVVNLLECWKDKQTPIEIKDRGQETILAYKAAIRHGTRPLQHTRFMLVGPERVGKTSLKNALLGYDFNILEDKTDGIKSSTCRIDIEDISNWEEDVNDPGYNISQYIAKETANILKKKSVPTSSTTLLSPASLSSTVPPSSTSLSLSPSSSLLSSPTSSSTSSSLNLSSAKVAEEVEKNDSSSMAEEGDNEDSDKLPKDISRLVNTYMKWSDESLEEKCKLLFSVWDFAGHYLYYTMHQVFLSPRAIYCVVFDASKNLHDKADLDFLPVGSYEAIDQEFTLNHEMTNLEFLNFWISSIFSHVPANKQSGDSLLSPPVFIVGTHLDLIPGTDEEKQHKLDDISKTIKDYLEDKAYRGHVVPQIYFVDNSLRPVGESLKKFREDVEEVMRKQPYMEDRIPISWFRFQSHVIKLRKEKDYITLEEAREISTSLGIHNDKEMFTMLRLFHDVGVVAFYGSDDAENGALGEMIVLNPQWLINVFIKVITINKREKKWTNFNWCWRILEEKGILEETLVNHVWSDFSKSQIDTLLKIMERFDLLCENKVQRDESDALATVDSQLQRQFFVPCQLRPNKEDHGKIWESDLNAVVINIIPKDGFLPEGLFHRLTVRAAVWTQQKESCQSKPPRLFYRQTELYLDEDHELIMRMHVTKMGKRMIKIIIYYPPVENDESSRSPTPSMCKEVLVFLQNSLNDLKHMWMKRIDFGVYVPCYTCKKFDDHYHLLQKCLEKEKTACGKTRRITSFWQSLFGDQQVDQEVRHPMNSLPKTVPSDMQANEISLAPPVTDQSSPDIENSELTSSSTRRFITELTPADVGPINNTSGNQGNGTTCTVIGNDNIIILGNQGIVNINQRYLQNAFMVTMCVLVIFMTLIHLMGTY